MSKLCLVDSRVNESSVFMNSVQPDVSVVLIDYENDTFSSLLSSIQDLPRPLSIAYVAHGTFDPTYSFFSGSSFDMNVESDWQPFIEFLNALKPDTLTPWYFDFLGCSLASDPKWKQVFGWIEKTGVKVRASLDATGNLAHGANWILEDGAVDAKALYFTNLDNFEGLLAIVNVSAGSFTFTSSTVSPYTANGVSFTKDLSGNWINNDTIVLLGNVTFNIASGITVTCSGGISGTGAITKSELGTLILSGSNSYNGLTTLSSSGGTLKITNYSASSFNISTSSTLEIANTGLLTLNGTILLSGTLSIANTGLLTLVGAITGYPSGALTILTGGSLKFFNPLSGTTNLNGSFTNNGTFENENTGALTLSGAFNNSGTFTVTSNVTLSNATISSTGPISVPSNKTLTISNNASISESITGDGTISVASGKTLTIPMNKTVSISPIISSAGNLTVNGTLNLSNTVTITGSFSGSGVLNSGVLNSNTVTLSPTTTPTSEFSGTINVTNGTLNLGSSAKYSPNITGTINVSSATLFFNGTLGTAFNGYIYSTSNSSPVVKVLTYTFSNFNVFSNFSGKLYVELLKSLTIAAPSFGISSSYTPGRYTVTNGIIYPLTTLSASDISSTSITVGNLSYGTLKYSTSSTMSSPISVGITGITSSLITNLTVNKLYYFQLFEGSYPLSNQLLVSTTLATFNPVITLTSTNNQINVSFPITSVSNFNLYTVNCVDTEDSSQNKTTNITSNSSVPNTTFSNLTSYHLMNISVTLTTIGGGTMTSTVYPISALPTILDPPNDKIINLSSILTVSDALVTYPMLYSNAVFTHDGTKWFVEYTESSTAKKDTLIGVKKVAFSDKNVYLYGAGSGCNNIFNTSTTVSVSNASQCYYVNRDVVLYAGGTTYIATQNKTYYIDKTITIKSIPIIGSSIISSNENSPTSNAATIRNDAGNLSTYWITSSDVILQDIILDYNSKPASTLSFIKIGSNSASTDNQINNVTLKNVSCINLNVRRGIDINFSSNITIDNCYQIGTVEYYGIIISGSTICNITKSNIESGKLSTIQIEDAKIPSLKIVGTGIYLGTKYIKNSNGYSKDPTNTNVSVDNDIAYFINNHYVNIDATNTYVSSIANKPPIINISLFNNYPSYSVSPDNIIIPPSFTCSFSGQYFKNMPNPINKIYYTQHQNDFTIFYLMYNGATFIQASSFSDVLSNCLLVLKTWWGDSTVITNGNYGFGPENVNVTLNGSRVYPLGYGSISITDNTDSTSKKAGDVLTADYIPSDYTLPAGVTYTWYNSNSSVIQANSSNQYTVLPSDAGYSIYVVMSGNDGGPFSQTSLPVGPFSLITPDIGSFSFASKNVGDIFDLTPSSNSSGDFSYSSDSNIATISGSKVTIVGSGSVTITATQAASGNYSSVSVSATLIIKADPSIMNLTASPINYGSNLSSSELSNGIAYVGNSSLVLGVFSNISTGTANNTGSVSVSYKFEPTNPNLYNIVLGTVSVEVKPVPGVCLDASSIPRLYESLGDVITEDTLKRYEYLSNSYRNGKKVYPFYKDNDGDGHGSGTVEYLESTDGTPPLGYSTMGDDENDGDSSYYKTEDEGKVYVYGNYSFNGVTYTSSGPRTYTQDFTKHSIDLYILPTPTINVGTYVYNSYSQGPSSMLNHNGPVTYSYYKGIEKLSTAPVDVGSYSVSANIDPYNNYPAISITDSFTISRALSTISVSINDVTYGNIPSPVPSVTGSDADVTYSYYNSDNTLRTSVPSDVGRYSVVASVAQNQNYSEANSYQVSFNINQKSLTITGLTVNNKVYDGNNSATLNGGLLSETVSDVTLSGTLVATFNNSSVGSKTVTVTGYSLTGANSSNYSVTQPILTADITPKELTITGLTVNNKVYDGTTTATVSGNPSYYGLVDNESYTVTSSGSWSFNDSSVGTKGVSGVTYQSPSSNYSLTQPILTGEITKALSTISVSINSVIVGTTLSPPVSVVTGSNGTVSYLYKVENGIYSQSIPTAVGSYSVKATLSEDTNFSGAISYANFNIYKSPSVIDTTELKIISSTNDIELFRNKIIYVETEPLTVKPFTVLIADPINPINPSSPSDADFVVDLSPITNGQNFIIFKDNKRIRVGNYIIQSNPSTQSSTQSLTITLPSGKIKTVSGLSISKPFEIKPGVYVTFRFGSVTAESAPSAGSRGDPYVTTFSGHKYKLPNILRTYRLLEHDNVIINATVSELTDSEKEEMKQIGLKEGTEKMFNGYFYESFYITNGKDSILFDRHLNVIENDGYEITKGKGQINCPIEGKSDYTSKTITVDDIEIKLMKYRNPQILNGIDVTVGDPSNSKGILNSIYNPKDSMVKSIKSVKPLKEAKGIVYNYKQKELWVKKRVHL